MKYSTIGQYAHHLPRLKEDINGTDMKDEDDGMERI